MSLCIPGQVAPAFCTTGQRQTAASARTDRRDAVLSCGVAESPSLLRRPCEAEIEFLCHEAFLMGICTCEREGTLVRVQCRSGIVRENRLEMFFYILPANKMPLLHLVTNLCECSSLSYCLCFPGHSKVCGGWSTFLLFQPCRTADALFTLYLNLNHA